MADNEASNIPPFIPGLLIVSLMILISILLGWRNYMRRTRPATQSAPTLNVNWLQGEEAEEEVAAAGQRPRLWEVAVDGGGGRRHVVHSWEKAMPLSAVSMDGPDLSSSHNAARPSSSSSSWLPKYFSSSARKNAPPPPHPTTPPPLLLQVSLIIVMPQPQEEEVDVEDMMGPPVIALGLIVLPSEKKASSTPHAEHKDKISSPDD